MLTCVCVHVSQLAGDFGDCVLMECADPSQQCVSIVLGGGVLGVTRTRPPPGRLNWGLLFHCQGLHLAMGSNCAAGVAQGQSN